MLPSEVQLRDSSPDRGLFLSLMLTFWLALNGSVKHSGREKVSMVMLSIHQSFLAASALLFQQHLTGHDDAVFDKDAVLP